MAKSIPSLPQEQVHPALAAGINLDCCGDPDCGNDGVAPDPAYGRFKGSAGTRARLAMSASSPAIASGVGRHVLDAPSKDLGRVSDVPEYANDPHLWSDGRTLVCHRLGSRAPRGGRSGQG